jgi:Tol biopolymer transport system component
MSRTQPQVQSIPSGDAQWSAYLDDGGLRLYHAALAEYKLFPSGSTIESVIWSPDSARLLAVQSNLALIEPTGSGFEVTGPLAIWSVTTADLTPRQLADLPESAESPSQMQWGQWSPDGRYVAFWSGPLSASILADGLPLSILDSTGGTITPLGDSSLYTPTYHTWSPDSSRLAVTLGGGREAWRGKSLAIFDLAMGMTTPVAAAADQIPGRVAWSPDGSRIAYAANPAASADLEPSTITFDNPGIAARRIYLLDVAIGATRPLNDVDSFQDAPVWNADGSTLYYIQRVDDSLRLMAADSVSGVATAVEGASEPLPDLAGYYGLFDWSSLLQQIPE